MAKRILIACVVLGLTVGGTGTLSEAVGIDAGTLFSNWGFEQGDLSGWTVTRPNTSYVASLSPPVNPTINPADASNSPATLTAPAGAYFTGITRPDDVGPDLAYKLAHNAVALSSVATGTTFQVTVFANRGRLEPFDTPESTAEVLVKIFGWSAGKQPTVNASNDNWSRTINWNAPAQSFNFTGVGDGTWAQQSFVFDPVAQGFNAANLRYLSVSIAGRTLNHDQYVAIDLNLPPAPIPEPATLLLLGSGVAGLAVFGRKRLRRPPSGSVSGSGCSPR